MSEVEVPRIRSRDGNGPINFSSKLIPPYLRRSKSIDALAAYAYLKGISERDMAQVLEVVLGEGAKKLTPNVVSSLKVEWQAKFGEWKKRGLSRDTFSYVYADGIYQEIRGDNPKLCVLVVIGVDDQGKKHLLALEDGTRESTQSWREVLIDLKSRGMNEPLLAIGDGALGFWAALSEIYPETKHRRLQRVLDKCRWYVIRLVDTGDGFTRVSAWGSNVGPRLRQGLGLLREENLFEFGNEPGHLAVNLGYLRGVYW